MLEDQSKLAEFTVAIVGGVGLGGSLAEELSRLGIGNLIFVDGHWIEESNLNRQLFATEKKYGTAKSGGCQGSFTSSQLRCKAYAHS